MIYIYFMILVTGGTGLVGSHLLYDLVKRGLPVRALRRKESNVNEVKKIFSYYSEDSESLFSRIEWAEGDLMDVFSLAEAMKGITDVYHCAAIVSIDSGDGEKMIRNNVTGTTNMVNMALENKIRKFCHVSSVAALGIESGKDITEETAWNNDSNFSAYAISKYLSENEVWRGTQEGLNAVIVNPTIVIGPGNLNRSSGLLFKAAQKGLRWYSSGGMGYVDVRDVVKAMILLMDSDLKNEKFILTSENLPFKDFFELVYNSIGKKIPNKKAGKFILELVWRADKLKSIFTGSAHIFTKEVARYASIQLAYSNSKVKNKINFRFTPVSKAVSDTAKCFISDQKSKNN